MPRPASLLSASVLVLAWAAAPARADEAMPGPAPAPTPAPAPAPEPAPGPVSGRFFDANDANLDGKVTKAEFLAQGRDEETFGLFDKDGDGVVTLEEVGLPADYKPKPLPPPGEARGGPGGGMAERLRRAREELLAMDADKDGKVSREEYKGKRPFEALDRNKDGFLSAEDRPPGREGGGGVEQRFQERDKNGDGRLTADEMRDAARFAELDGNKDGGVTLEEMRAAAPGKGGAPGGAMRGDRDGDGKVSREEFPGTDDAFRGLDVDGDGFLVREELAKARPGGRAGAPPRETTPPVAPGAGGAGALFAALDRDGDGRLARNEFSGDDAAWRSLDADSDGWITAAEAQRGR